MCTYPVERLHTSAQPTAEGLPNWAAFYTALGRYTANTAANGLALTIAVSTPLRAYAAVFAAAGAVQSRLGLQLKTDQFSLLWASAPGTSVRFRTQGREHLGTLTGTSTVRGERYLWVQGNAAGTSRVGISERMKENIVAAGANARPLKRVHSREITINSWLCALLSPHSHDSFVFQSQKDCLLVGQSSVLESEAEVLLYHVQDTYPITGSLKTLLRVRRWEPDAAAYRCDLQTTYGSPVDGATEYHAAVFDGAAAYLRWHRELPLQHHIIVLDRTESAYATAVDEVNSAYLYRAEGPPLPGLQVPCGTEMTAFWRSA